MLPQHARPDWLESPDSSLRADPGGTSWPARMPIRPTPMSRDEHIPMPPLDTPSHPSHPSHPMAACCIRRIPRSPAHLHRLRLRHGRDGLVVNVRASTISSRRSRYVVAAARSQLEANSKPSRAGHLLAQVVSLVPGVSRCCLISGAHLHLEGPWTNAYAPGAPLADLHVRRRPGQQPWQMMEADSSRPDRRAGTSRRQYPGPASSSSARACLGKTVELRSLGLAF